MKENQSSLWSPNEEVKKNSNLSFFCQSSLFLDAVSGRKDETFRKQSRIFLRESWTKIKKNIMKAYNILQGGFKN